MQAPILSFALLLLAALLCVALADPYLIRWPAVTEERRNREPPRPAARVVAAYQRFVDALIESIDHLDAEHVSYLRLLAMHIEQAQGIPPDLVEIERRLDDLVAEVQRFRDAGNDLDDVKHALRVRASIRRSEGRL